MNYFRERKTCPQKQKRLLCPNSYFAKKVNSSVYAEWLNNKPTAERGRTACEGLILPLANGVKTNITKNTNEKSRKNLDFHLFRITKIIFARCEERKKIKQLNFHR